MTNIVQDLTKKGLITPPKWLPNNLQYLTQMGSHAYGVARKGKSDFDLYGMVIPPKHIIFPHYRGVIWKYDKQFENFDTWQEHHVQSPDPNKPREWDFAVWSIIKYFDNLRNASPNVIDSLFTAQDCVMVATPVAVHIRNSRQLFLSQKIFHTFSGYAYSQLKKMNRHEEYTKYAQWAQAHNIPLEASYAELHQDWRLARAKMFAEMRYPDIPAPILKLAYRKLEHLEVPTTKRVDDLLEYGYDIKFAYHLIRLLLEAEQLLDEQDLDLRRNRELLKSIRAGDWPKENVVDFFEQKEKILSQKRDNTKLPHSPDDTAIKALLLECLEMHYGNLGPDLVDAPEKHLQAIQEIYRIAEEVLKNK